MKLVVGLGNPGAEFQDSRHNVGYDVLDVLGSSWQEDKRFNALVDQQPERILVKPLTFMNHSGEAVLRIVDFYKIAPEDILVVRDDIDMETGKVRGPVSGSSSAGHKGVESIAGKLKTKKFWQIKMGVGRPPARELINGYVLEKFDKGEKELVEKGLKEMVERTQRWLEN